MASDHPHTDPGDGRSECQRCGKWIYPITHSCKGVPVTEAAQLRAKAIRTDDHTAVATETLEGCERCEQPIQAGERYVLPLPGIGLVEHVDCPTQETA